jgi:hypothetical protein
MRRPDATSAVERQTFRANPGYELVLRDRLAPAERELLAETESDGDLYGVLRPRPGSGLEPRSASSETALLFLTLSEPGPLPTYVVARLGDDLERTISRFVLDGVLEIEHEGKFLCGAQAADLLVTGSSAGGRGRIGELSIAALRYGQELGDLPEPLLALRLYLYGRRPVSAALRSRLPDAAAVDAYLGLAPGGSARAALDAGWVESLPSGEERTYWRHWRPRRMHGAPSPGGVSYKLYVSPTPEALETAVGTVASSLAGAPGLAAFKVGSDLHGICRPDKLVAYFDRLEDLQEGAALLRDRLGECPAHGVPFTAAVTQDGLLSWGADPPARSSANGSESGSWRMWVTERLAEYLTLARTGRGAVEPWQFALERLRLAGIDTDTWIPASGMWPEAFASA